MTDEPRARRWLPISLAAVAAACLAIAAWSPRWLASRDGNERFGLRAFTLCTDAGCTTIANDETIERMSLSGIDHASPAFAPLGAVTFGALLAAVASLLSAVVLAVARRRLALPFSLTTVAFAAIVVAMVTAGLFCVLKPGNGGSLRLSWGFFVFAAGAISGIASARLLAP